MLSFTIISQRCVLQISPLVLDTVITPDLPSPSPNPVTLAVSPVMVEDTVKSEIPDGSVAFTTKTPFSAPEGIKATPDAKFSTGPTKSFVTVPPTPLPFRIVVSDATTIPNPPPVAAVQKRAFPAVLRPLPSIIPSEPLPSTTGLTYGVYLSNLPEAGWAKDRLVKIFGQYGTLAGGDEGVIVISSAKFPPVAYVGYETAAGRDAAVAASGMTLRGRDIRVLPIITLTDGNPSGKSNSFSSGSARSGGSTLGSDHGFAFGARSSDTSGGGGSGSNVDCCSSSVGGGGGGDSILGGNVSSEGKKGKRSRGRTGGARSKSDVDLY